MCEEIGTKADTSRVSAALGRDPWAHRSEGMRCATCMWFVLKVDGKEGPRVSVHEKGRCRRHAPTMGGYPVVFSSDWCGDHKLA